MVTRRRSSAIETAARSACLGPAVIRRRSTRADWLKANGPGDASKYCGHVKYVLRRRQRVVLCLRVSGRTQGKRKNLRDQERCLRRYMRKYGAIVVGVVKYVGSGVDPTWLGQAAAIAEREGAILVAETLDRFVRSELYHSERNPEARASERELMDLKFCTFGVELATLIRPNASLKLCRSFQSKRGQREKGRKGGRPLKKTHEPAGYKLAIRRKYLPTVLKLKKQGMSVRDIAKKLGLAKSTVDRWIRVEGLGVSHFLPTASARL